jgi:hypothetical protein
MGYRSLKTTISTDWVRLLRHGRMGPLPVLDKLQSLERRLKASITNGLLQALITIFTDTTEELRVIVLMFVFFRSLGLSK